MRYHVGMRSLSAKTRSKFGTVARVKTTTRHTSRFFAIAKRSDKKIVAYIKDNAPTAADLQRAEKTVERARAAKNADFLQKYRVSPAA